MDIVLFVPCAKTSKESGFVSIGPILRIRYTILTIIKPEIKTKYRFIVIYMTRLYLIGKQEDSVSYFGIFTTLEQTRLEQEL